MLYRVVVEDVDFVVGNSRDRTFVIEADPDEIEGAVKALHNRSTKAGEFRNPRYAAIIPEDIDYLNNLR